LILDLIGLTVSFAFLGFSSWRDIVSREVPDRLWLFAYPLGLVLLTARFFAQSQSSLLMVISLVSALAVSIVLPYLGLWGGADGKAFLCLAILNPLIPSFGLHMPDIVDPFFPLVVFSNAYVASLVSLGYPIQRNLRTRRSHTLFEGLEEESLFRKIGAFLTGYRVPVDELKSRPFLFPIETVHQHGLRVTRHFRFDLRVDWDPQKALAEVKAASDSGLIHGTIWVSPGLPFLVFLTAGLCLTLVLGDIVWYVVSSALNLVLA